MPTTTTEAPFTFRFEIGQRVKLIGADMQDHVARRIGQEFTITRRSNNGHGDPRWNWYSDFGDMSAGYYENNLELVTSELKTPTEVEARLAMYEAMPVKTVAVHVIIEELQWVIGALHRAEAVPDAFDTEDEDEDED